jgi:hypothetical protein
MMHNKSRKLLTTTGNSAQFWLLCILIVSVTRETLYFFASDVVYLNPIDYLLFAVASPYLLVVFRRSDSYTKFMVLVLLGLTVMGGQIGHWQAGNLFIADNIAKFLFPIILIMVTASHQIKLNAFQIKATVVIVSIFALSGILRVFAPQSNTSLTEFRHSTAYLIAGVTLIIWVSQLKFSTKLMISPFLVFPLLLLDVATATISLGIFISLEVSNKWKAGRLLSLALGLTVVFFVVSTRTDLFNLDSDGLGLLGSGRVAAWQDGISNFLSHGAFEQLFGQGSGSSFQFWGVWWWSEKDIHSDFLRVLIENGLIVFIVLLVTLYGVNRRLQNRNSTASSVLLSAIVTSVISNGVFGRPYASILWVFALIIAGQTSRPDNELTKSSEVFERPRLNRQKPTL